MGSQQIGFAIHLTPRAVQSGTRAGVSKNGKPFIYSDTSKHAYIRNVGLLSKQYAPAKPWDGPLVLHITFYLPRLKNSKSVGWEYCTVRPDLDNLEKGTIDGLSLSGFWEDDSQICYKFSQKLRHAPYEKPRIVITINKL